MAARGGAKIPSYITLHDCPLLALAGIYDCWRNDAAGETVAAYSILTIPADEPMRYNHNTRFGIPVILRPVDEERWLDPRLTKTGIAAFFTPISDSEIQSGIIGTVFIRKASDDPTTRRPGRRPEKHKLSFIFRR